MAAFVYGNNKDYLIQVIAILRIIEQKGMASDINKAWGALVKVRREMRPFLSSLKMRLKLRRKFGSRRFQIQRDP
jgi:hypothetical protein